MKFDVTKRKTGYDTEEVDVHLHEETKSLIRKIVALTSLTAITVVGAISLASDRKPKETEEPYTIDSIPIT